MPYIFWTIAGIGGAYFALAKRRMDAFSVAFFGALIYFQPAFVGYVNYPAESYFMIKVELIPQTYLAMAIVLAAVLIGGVLWDRIMPSRGPQLVLSDVEFAPVFAVLLGVIGFAGVLLTTGSALLLEDKVEMMEHLNRWYILSNTGAVVGTVLSFVSKRRVLFVIAFSLLIFDLFVGFRASNVAAVVAILMVSASRRGPFRLLQNWKIVVFGMFFIAVILLYKNISTFVKLGYWEKIIEAVTDPDWYLLTLGSSEPFTTQAILNKVLQTGFAVDPGYLWALLYTLLPFAPELGAEIVSFNDLFQQTLFPQVVGWGMAGNIWAEAFAIGGWPGLILFAVVFAALLGFGSYLLLARDQTVRAGAALALSWLAYLVHRNDLLVQTTLEKRIISVWIVCVLVSMFVSWTLVRPVRRAKKQASLGVRQ